MKIFSAVANSFSIIAYYSIIILITSFGVYIANKFLASKYVYTFKIKGNTFWNLYTSNFFKMFLN